jgi:hypothetical protein
MDTVLVQGAAQLGDNRLIAIGLVRLRRVPRPSFLSPILAPEEILTASRCFWPRGGENPPCDLQPMADADVEPEREGWAVLALMPADGEALGRELDRETSECDGSLKAAVADRRPALGSIIGFDVLGYDTGRFHSWLCHGLETEVEQKLAIRPGPDGLLPDLISARAVADYTNGLGGEVEPVLWLAYAYLQAASTDA